MLSPAVSVIIPCYNAAKYLDRCMESLLNQTLQNIEIICVDDGSADDTLEKLNNYAKTDKRVRVLSQQNQFAGAARNLGLTQARGEYILFLDSDDFFEENLAQDAFSAAASNDADIVLFNAQCFDEQNGEFKKGWFLNSKLIPDREPFSREDCPDHFYQITTAVPWTKLFRRKFLLDTKLQFQTLRHTNDFFFVFSALAMAKRIVVLDKILVNYRVGQKNNLQSTKNRSPLCFYDAYKALHDKLEELGLLPKLHRSFANQVLGGCLYNLRSMNDLESQKTVFEKLRREIFDRLDIPEGDVSFFFIEANYYEMLLVKHGTFEQYLAYRASRQIQDLWHCAQRGCFQLRSCDTGTKAYRQALAAVTEKMIKALERRNFGDSNEYIEEAYQIAHDTFKRQEFADVTVESFTDHQLYQKFATVQNSGYREMKVMLGRRLVVSMTTYPARIGALEPVLNSLYNQDRKADEILLWLAKEEFPGLEQDLPEYLVQLAAQKRLTIRWCDNLKPHKKYFYALQEYPEDLIVTVDDDLLYSSSLLSSLYRSYLQYPKAVSAVRVHLMLFSEDNRILPYNTWIRETDCSLHTPSMQLFATGGAGTLYPPHLFRKEFFDWTAISAHCPIADDLWLKAMELISGVPVVAARPREPLQYLPGSQEDALKQINDIQNFNDIQLANIIRWTDEVFGRDALKHALTDPLIGRPILGMEAVSYQLDQERRALRQQLQAAQQRETATKNALQQTVSQKEAKLQEVSAKLRETEKKLREAEAKQKAAETKLQKARIDVQKSEESKPIHCQMKDLGIMLKGLRQQGHSRLSVGFKLLVYAVAWIPELILVFLMYFLRNGFVQTVKHTFRKLFPRG